MIMLSIRSFVKSVRAAVYGLIYVLHSERNFRIELYCAFGVVALMCIFDMTMIERAIVTVVVILVLLIELINTAIERIIDILKPRVHPYARVVKDIMAGTVLLSSVGAVVIGILIFSPYVYALFEYSYWL